MAENDKTDFSFKIKEHIGIINSLANGWTKELNVVSWNDGTPKYDIREWNQEHSRMTRGITLHPEELKSLRELIQERAI